MLCSQLRAAVAHAMAQHGVEVIGPYLASLTVEEKSALGLEQ
jgi:hypothetical protein